MLGTYRLSLALLVAMSHIGIRVLNLHIGVVAVVGFYLVSGYVMTGLIRSHYAALDKATNFYFDRALRLLPHYLTVAFVTLVCFQYAAIDSAWLRVKPTILNILSNVLIVPQNFYMFNGSDKFALIPPAWSLGAEIQFYLLLPFILILNLRNAAIALSFLVYLCAAFGIINSDWFGYRLLPGVLFIFLIGSLLYDLHKSDCHLFSWHKRVAPLSPFPPAVAVASQQTLRESTVLVSRQGTRIAIACASAVFFLLLVLKFSEKLSLPFNRETLLGLAIGVLVVNFLAPQGRQKLDEMLGHLSYGVFLNHFFVKDIIFGGRVIGAFNVILFLATSVLIAMAMYWLVELPSLRFRKRLRKINFG